jgi:peptidyl-tRNA hydrolase, PTH1 family
MYLIIGLGNPEAEYSRTRHNMGFDVINKLASKYNIEVNRKKFNSLYGKGEIEGQKVVLVKPQTYMNLSGDAVGQFVSFYKVEPNEILVIYDDLDVEKGIIKIRKKGGPGTHNGMKSVVSELATDEFPRIRVGIGEKEKAKNMIDFVIKKVDDETYSELEKGIEKAADSIPEILKNGIDMAMNKFN